MHSRLVMPHKNERANSRTSGTSRSFSSVCGLVLFALFSSVARAQSAGGSFMTREALSAAASQADLSGNQPQAAAIRQRLATGDFKVGDRIVVGVVSDVSRTDTITVRDGLTAEIPGRGAVSLSGVLRSELKDKVTAAVLVYVKAYEVSVTPLTRIAVLGEVVHPGYFALRSDIPISDAIMIAGGPTASADLKRSIVRRDNREFRSQDQTREALADGTTLDQLGLAGGDELVVGKQRPFVGQSATTLLGVLGSVAAIVIAVRH